MSILELAIITKICAKLIGIKYKFIKNILKFTPKIGREMKHLISIMLFFFSFIPVATGQSRGIMAKKPIPDARVNEAKLKLFFRDVEDYLSCRAGALPADSLFLTGPSAQKYVESIFDADVIREDANRVKATGAFYASHSQDTKNFLYSLKDRFSGLEYYGFATRQGMTARQYIITTSFNLVYTDLSKEIIRINVVDDRGRYRILNIEE